MPKAKIYSGDGPSKKRRTSVENHCIIHDSHITDPGNFTLIKNLEDPDGRFSNLLNIKQRRLSAPPGSVDRQEAVCLQIPAALEDNHGYHRKCYSRYTNHLDRIPPVSTTSASTQPTPSTSRRKSGDNIIFNPDCIFCNVAEPIRVSVGGKTVFQKTSLFEYGGGQRVIDIAHQRQDEKLLCRIQNQDLFSYEARYHSSCRKKYTTEPRWRSTDQGSIARQEALEKSHNQALTHVIDFLNEAVLGRQEIMLLSQLRTMYVKELTNTDFPNEDYRADKLKRKLQNHPEMGPKLGFTLVKSKTGPFSAQAVFDNSISVSRAICKTYELVSEDPVKSVVQELRESILKAYSTSTQDDSSTWPPDPRTLLINENVIPMTLQRFMNLLLFDKEEHSSSRSERLMYSLGQDICRAVTNGEWKMPKHILLCVTFRHLFCSKQLIQLLNRLGHCENSSFATELEVAIASKIQSLSSHLTPQIVRGPANVVFHSEWDNFNQFLSGVHGSPMCNTAGGIMMQEVSNAAAEVEPPRQEPVDAAPVNTLTYVTLPDLHVQRKGPVITLVQAEESQENRAAYESGIQKYLIWSICRNICSRGIQQVPADAGFVSATGLPPQKLTTIDYYPMINEPITNFKVVKELLTRCQRATEEVGQAYTITTFDLGVIMKAMPIIWEKPDIYSKHVVLIGSFHTIMNALKMVGHKMAGSGYAEILVEANLVTSGCLQSVLNGKNYAKSLWCLKAVCEGLERLLFMAFMDDLAQDSPHHTSNIAALSSLIQSPSQPNLQKLLLDPSMLSLLVEYTEFQDQVRRGVLGKTAAFWISFLDHARRIFMLIYAVKCNQFPLFHKSMCDMAELFFAFGGHNYARYLTWFDVFLTNIHESHPGAKHLLEHGAISVARSSIAGNRCAPDKTMEETFMRFSKAKSGRVVNRRKNTYTVSNS